jgi:hypothetical protein
MTELSHFLETLGQRPDGFEEWLRSVLGKAQYKPEGRNTTIEYIVWIK